MIKTALLIITLLFGLSGNLYASDTFLLTAEITQNDQIIGNPKILLPEKEEGVMEIIGVKGFSLSAIISTNEEIIIVTSHLSLNNNGLFESVVEPVFVVKSGETGEVEIKHPVFGKVVLKIQVNKQKVG